MTLVGPTAGDEPVSGHWTRASQSSRLVARRPGRRCKPVVFFYPRTDSAASHTRHEARTASGVSIGRMQLGYLVLSMNRCPIKLSGKWCQRQECHNGDCDFLEDEGYGSLPMPTAAHSCVGCATETAIWGANCVNAMLAKAIALPAHSTPMPGAAPSPYADERDERMAWSHAWAELTGESPYQTRKEGSELAAAKAMRARAEKAEMALAVIRNALGREGLLLGESEDTPAMFTRALLSLRAAPSSGKEHQCGETLEGKDWRDRTDSVCMLYKGHDPAIGHYDPRTQTTWTG